MNGEWQLQGPPPDPEDLWLDPENVKRFRGYFEMECAGTWEDIEREVFTDPAQVAALLEGEPLVVSIRIDFSSLAREHEPTT